MAFLDCFRVKGWTSVPLFLSAPKSRWSEELRVGFPVFQDLAPSKGECGLIIFQAPFSKLVAFSLDINYIATHSLPVAALEEKSALRKLTSMRSGMGQGGRRLLLKYEWWGHRLGRGQQRTHWNHQALAGSLEAVSASLRFVANHAAISTLSSFLTRIFGCAPS